MAYILMTRMQYLELTGVIPRFNRSFESDWERENKERFRRNHPYACKCNEEEDKKNGRIYQKFDFGRRPKEPLSNDDLIKAIKVCSEQPSKCFYMEEALSQLGYYHIYSYEDRFNALMQATNTGSAVLIEEGFGGGGASPAPKPKEEGFINRSLKTGSGLTEATLVTAHNAGWDMSAAAGALGHGIMQFTKEGSIEDATRVAKESYKNFSGQVKKELSPNAQKAVDENYILQGAGYAIENTVVPVIEELSKTLPEPVVVFGGLALSAIPSGKSIIGKNIVKITDVNIGSFIIKDKHLSDSTAKRFRKFNASTPDEANKIVQDAIKNGRLVETTFNSIGSANQKSYSSIIDAGKVIGTKNETHIKIVYDELKNVWTTYPIPK